MSTSPTLPAGYFITTIGTQRCTAVPRSLTTLTGSEVTEAAAQPPTTSTASTVAAGGTTIASTGVVSTTAATTPTTAPLRHTSTASSGEFTAVAETTPSKSTSSSTQIPIAQTVPSSTSASTSVDTPTGDGISSNSAPSPGPIVGGVLGSMVFVALLALLFFFLRRRRKNQRESLLTPLTTGVRSSFYSDEPPKPPARSNRWKAEIGYRTDRLRNASDDWKASLVGFGASLRSKVARDRSDAPNVNLNRGNSQFLDGPIPQHSRNNSVLSGHGGHGSLKEKATDWWQRLGEALSLSWLLRRKVEDSPDPFASARSMTEKQAHMNNPPDFSKLLGMEDRVLQLEAEQRRISLARGDGSLGLSFSAQDPFADPTVLVVGNNSTSGVNPFADPPTRPEPSMAKANTYIADIRRSRGQSIDTTATGNNASAFVDRPPTASARYPSTIRVSHDSYRDTVLSAFSATTRKGKGRSDPFDLERPELWTPRTANKDMYPSPLNPHTNASTKAHGILGMDINGQPGRRVDSNQTFLSSKYSSGVSRMSEWGDPGPDVEPGSLDGGSILSRAETNSNASGSGEYSHLVDAMPLPPGSRGTGNISPVSNVSSKGGVGKAV